jgi:signal transduction histidine kinase
MDDLRYRKSDRVSNQHLADTTHDSDANVLERSVDVSLEIARVDLLYQQNIPGILALLLYCSSYVFVSWKSTSHEFLINLSVILACSALARVISTIMWNQRKQAMNSIRQARLWLHFLEAMLLITGLGGGAVGLRLFDSTSYLQQIIIALSVLFMSAGAVVCYIASTTAVCVVVLPAVAGLVMSLLLSKQADFIALGYLTIVYLVLGLLSSNRLARYVLASLRLSVEKAELAVDLRQQIQSKERAQAALEESQTRLALALESSNAFVWQWDSATNKITSQGDSLPLLEYAMRFQQEDQGRFLVELSKINSVRQRFEGDFAGLTKGQMCFYSYIGRSQENLEPGEPLKVSGVFWNVTHKKTQDALRRERDILEAANQAKSMFLANASHEIRTPLSSINGFADILLKSTRLSVDVRSDLEIIARNGKYLFSLVNDLLDLSRMETDRLFVQKSVVTLITEIKESMLLLSSALREKNLKLSIRYTSPVPVQIKMDATRFRQILLNLLSNAVKFSDQGVIHASIQYSPLSPQDGILSLVMSDCGIGMSIDEQKNLFEPFVRGADAAVQRVQGAGLGLALSRKLAQALNGELQLVSSKKGLGSVFELKLKIEFEPNTIFATPPDDNFGTGLQVAPSSLLPAAPTSGPQAQALLGAKILVVDDAPDLRNLMQRYLTRQGADVTLRENGLEALQTATADRFDLILMDMKMPVMTGYEACRQLRDIGYQRPIIAVTAHANIDDRQRCYEAGCDDYVSKPVDQKHLIDMLIRLRSRNPLL